MQKERRVSETRSETLLKTLKTDRLLHGVFQPLACLEANRLAGRNLNDGARLRVPSLAGSPTPDREGAESSDRHTLTFAERTRDLTQHTVYGRAGILGRQTC